jgi:LETM1-like protein
MRKYKQLKRYLQWKRDIKKNLDIKKITTDLIDFTKREANETRVAAKILSKILSNSIIKTDYPVTKREIKFLKDHSTDLAKLIPVLATLPTPIPYFQISLILKKFGIDLLPTEKDLEIPPDYQDK